ncbi:MAG: hypothetical protein M3516_05955 [Actinomycetota bacterium]|nr:hypothetical protein [Actinomycetota bacterium]
MAALTTQNVSAGGPVTVAAAAGGGDTFEQGTGAGGWSLSATFLYAVVGATATTITVDGTAYGPYTNQTVILPARSSGMSGAGTVAVTYSQVTSVTVGAVEVGPALD